MVNECFGSFLTQVVYIIIDSRLFKSCGSVDNDFHVFTNVYSHFKAIFLHLPVMFFTGHNSSFKEVLPFITHIFDTVSKEKYQCQTHVGAFSLFFVF